MGHPGLLLYKKWGSSGTPSEMGDNYIHNYYCHLYIWLKRRETSNTYHTGQRTEQTFPTMNISSSSNGFSLTGGLPPVPCFLFSLMKNYFFMLLNFSRTWSEVWRQTPQLLTFPAMSCHSCPHQLVSNLACQSALNYDFVTTSSRSTVISWCV